MHCTLPKQLINFGYLQDSNCHRAATNINLGCGNRIVSQMAVPNPPPSRCIAQARRYTLLSFCKGDAVLRLKTVDLCVLTSAGNAYPLMECSDPNWSWSP